MNAIDLLNNGLRVLITNKCNYRCFFCHSEGIDPSVLIEEKIDPLLIADFIRAGVRNLTISGGEPLLAFTALIELLDGIGSVLSEKECNRIELTIVTNGSLLTQEKLNLLRNRTSSYGKLKFNISLHSPVSDVYDAVTRTESMHQTVVANIRNAIEMGFEVCLNSVLLRNFNEREKEIDSIMEFSSSLGVPRIKIIEFLVTDLNKYFYSSFSRLDSVIYNHGHMASRKNSDSRRKVRHEYPEYNLEVDYTRCTCALGCSDCMKTREIEITPDNKVLGCIILPTLTIDSGESPLKIAGRVLNQLNCMKDKYGSYSPSLVFAPENVYGIGRFPVLAGKSIDDLFIGDMICTHREYRLYYLGKLPNSDFHFLLTEFDEDTHSKLVCYRQKEKSSGAFSWTEIDYLDPVYEFSRTRAEVNRKKVLAMGLELPEPICVKEDSVMLNHTPSEYSAMLRKLRENDVEKIFLEILRSASECWNADEPLHSARKMAEQHALDLSGI
jgi:molybdenum cofactor biosynthesis enzyme MoaA